MKKILIAITLSAAIFSCDRMRVGSANAENEDSLQSASHVYRELVNGDIPRDRSIDSTNSYSDLFLDSASIERYISENKLNENETRAFHNFYNLRNYQFAWFASDGLTEQGRAFWGLQREDTSTVDSDHSLKMQMDSIVENDTLQIPPDDTSFVDTELALTRAFIRYARSDPDGLFDRDVALTRLIPARKENVLRLAESILGQVDSTMIGHSDSTYQALRKQLEIYYRIAKQGGWEPVDSSLTSLRKGSRSPAIVAIKKRLSITGDYDSVDSSDLFNDSLASAIRSYQERNGFSANGAISDSLLLIMNTPVERVMERIIINMNRALWIPRLQANHISVNIPAYKLEIHDSAERSFEMDVIVGREGWNTAMVSGILDQVVFSPYWNVPSSIVREEILPAMKDNKNFLKSRNMEIVKDGDIPVIRQLPGRGNAMGKVKFLFDNPFDIYLHDTEAKSLFRNKDRAASHGCIRVEDAEKLAIYLLRPDSAWDVAKIRAAMNSGKEQWVKLKQPVMITINYYTVWVDKNEKIRFGKDIYGYDQLAAERLFANVV